MQITNREKFLLQQMLEFPISRYLMANTHGREDGFEKAQRHCEISKILCSFVTCSDIDSCMVLESWKPVHDLLAEELTDHMDETIQFPLHERLTGNDYDVYRERFFDKIIDNMGKIENIIQENTQ